jgi:hypothetical protein
MQVYASHNWQAARQRHLNILYNDAFMINSLVILCIYILVKSSLTVSTDAILYLRCGKMGY